MTKHKNIIILSTLLLLIIYVVGIVGILGESGAWYASLTSYNLLFVAVLLAITHGKFDRRDVYILLFSAIIGFGFEAIGVNTGWIFGSYEYGEALGIKLLDVSVVIGLNWAILTYCTMVIATKTSSNRWIKSLLGALLMVGLDVLIEPVAIKLDFWSWGLHNPPPLQNFIAWFIIAYLIQLVSFTIKPEFKNNFAVVVFLVLVVFFTILNFGLNTSI
ncbi:MAG: carotenoid biosynthesis protein [Crocinitomicaceae bacterium]|nr:carotenoid biosynthesis protein [Crocinitomicaceae bacterium]MBT6515842.1 carotenoid biosynthesis protein [Crocinitomicaceae bacterium]